MSKTGGNTEPMPFVRKWGNESDGNGVAEQPAQAPPPSLVVPSLTVSKKEEYGDREFRKTFRRLRSIDHRSFPEPPSRSATPDRRTPVEHVRSSSKRDRSRSRSRDRKKDRKKDRKDRSRSRERRSRSPRDSRESRRRRSSRSPGRRRSRSRDRRDRRRERSPPSMVPNSPHRVKEPVINPLIREDLAAAVENGTVPVEAVQVGAVVPINPARRLVLSLYHSLSPPYHFSENAKVAGRQRRASCRECRQFCRPTWLRINGTLIFVSFNQFIKNFWSTDKVSLSLIRKWTWNKSDSKWRKMAKKSGLLWRKFWYFLSYHLIIF